MLCVLVLVFVVVVVVFVLVVVVFVVVVLVVVIVVEFVLVVLYDQFLQLLSYYSFGFDVQVQVECVQLCVDQDDLCFSVMFMCDGYLYVLMVGFDGSLIQIFFNDCVCNNCVVVYQIVKLFQVSWLLKVVEFLGLEDFLVLVMVELCSFVFWFIEKDLVYGFLILLVKGLVMGVVFGVLSWLLGQFSCGKLSCLLDFGVVVFSVEVVCQLLLGNLVVVVVIDG